MEKIKRPEKVINEKVLEVIGDKRTLPNNILHRKPNWVGLLRRNFLLHDAIGEQMTEVKGVVRIRTQFFDDF